ncbi:MAG: hypothetical protein Kow009_07130 [Spirochaetales bacterium]
MNDSTFVRWRWTVLLLWTGFFASCGLETYTYLYPISTDSISSDKNVKYYQFTHNTDNDLDEFLGYEIFYKFYTPGSSEILSDRSALEDVYLATESPVTGRKFSRLRLKRVSDSKVLDTTPLLPISRSQRGTPWVFRIDFSPLLLSPQEPPILIWYQSDGTTEVERYILLRESRPEGGDEETFVPDQFLESDPDVLDMNVSNIVQNRGSLAVVFAVAAFGRNLDTSYLYSNIVFLNRSSSPEDDVLTIDLGP